MNQKSPLQLYHESQRRIFDQNEVFMAMVTNESHPLTKKELRILISKEPGRWSRYANWLESNALSEE